MFPSTHVYVILCVFIPISLVTISHVLAVEGKGRDSQVSSNGTIRVSKCCPLNFKYRFVGLGHNCDRATKDEESLLETARILKQDRFRLVNNFKHCLEPIVFYPEGNDSNEISILSNGNLFFENSLVEIPRNEYCLDYDFSYRLIIVYCPNRNQVTSTGFDTEVEHANNTNSTYVWYDFINREVIYSNSKTIRKCCKKGYNYRTGGYFCDEKIEDEDLLVPVYEEKESLGKVQFEMKYGFMICPDYVYYFLDELNPRKFFIQYDGYLLIEGALEELPPNQYCVDHNSENVLVVVYCPPPELKNADPLTSGQKMYWLGAKISATLYFLSFTVYVFLPKPNLFAKSLRFYLILLSTSYICGILIWDTEIRSVACTVLGLLFTFTSLSAFFWLNVLCIDIWLGSRKNSALPMWDLNISGFRGYLSCSKDKVRKRFLYYNLYAWGVPLILLMITVLVNFGGVSNKRAWYYPGFQAFCFYQGKLQSLLYFDIPIIFVEVLNLILFVMTLLRRWNYPTVKTQKVNCFYRIARYGRLFVVMGIHWLVGLIFFVLRWIQEDREIEYRCRFIVETVFTIVFFMTFVLQNNILLTLKNKYLIPRKSNVTRTNTT